MTGLIPRLRHLTAVFGRNFVVPREVSHDPCESVKVKFALSFIDPENFGYFYLSEPCENIFNPEWDIIDLSACSQVALAVKAVILTFFVVHNRINTVIFEVNVSFSGLVLVDTEIQNYMPPTTLHNQVYFNLSGNIYALPSCSQDSSNNFKPGLSLRCAKQSYDFDQLQRLLANFEATKDQEKQQRSLESYLFELQRFLRKNLNQQFIVEENFTNCVLLQQRIYTTKNYLTDLRGKLSHIENVRFENEGRLIQIYRESHILEDRIAATKLKCAAYHNQSITLNRAVSFRTRQLLFEVAELFAIELHRSGLMFSSCNTLHPTQRQAKGIHSSFKDNSLHFDHLSLAAQCRRLNPSADLNLGNITALLATIWTPPPSTRSAGIGNGEQHVQQSQTLDLITSGSASLGVVALFVRLLAAILSNQPLRHPIDMSDGYCRSKIIDHCSRELVDGDPAFPLFLAKNSLLPAYRHAIWLLTQNMVLLSPSPLIIPPVATTGVVNIERAAVSCLKVLLEKCLLTDSRTA